MDLWRVVSVTYERSQKGRPRWIPVVRHEMMGETRKRAIEVFKAHMKSDKFLRDCVTKGKFAGRVDCYTETYILPPSR